MNQTMVKLFTAMLVISFVLYGRTFAVNATIKPVSSLSSYSSGTTFLVEVKVGDPNAVSNLYGISFKLRSDQGWCTYVDGSALKGSFLGGGAFSFFQTVDTQTVDMAVTKTSGPGASGSGIVATAQFTTTTPGNATFSILDVIANDPVGDPILLDPDILTLNIILTNPSPGIDYTFNANVSGGSVPVIVHFNSITGGSTSVSIEAKDSSVTLPDTSVGSNRVLRRFWSISQTGMSTFNVDLTMHYLDADLVRAGVVHEESLRVFKRGSVKWQELAVVSRNLGGNTISVNGVTSFSDFIISETALDPLPIQLSSFFGSLVENNNIKLEWSTVSETNNYGFYVERRREGSGNYETVSELIPGAGSSLEEHRYVWFESAPAIDRFFYRLRQVDLNGDYTYSYEITIDAVLSEGEDRSMPVGYSLGQNYPNPFNPSTDFRFRISDFAHISLKVFDLLGREVATLVNEVKGAGQYTVTWNASNVPSGLYFYQLKAGTFVDTKKMVLMR